MFAGYALNPVIFTFGIQHIWTPIKVSEDYCSWPGRFGMILRDGANKMVKAYTASPGSKEARESLAEANKGYKEYTEVR